MAGFSAKIDALYFEATSFNRKLAEECRVAIREAAQKWLIACLRRIPVRTGFLQGSFTPLENLVGTVNKQTGVISRSKNPLVTRERKLHDLEKELRELEIHRRQAHFALEKYRKGAIVEAAKETKSVTKGTGLRARRDKRTTGAEQETHISQRENIARIKGEREQQWYERRIIRIEKRIRKLEADRMKYKGPRTKNITLEGSHSILAGRANKEVLEVIRNLESLRQQVIKQKIINTNKGAKGPFNPATKYEERKRYVREKIQAIRAEKASSLSELRERLKKKAKIEEVKHEQIKKTRTKTHLVLKNIIKKKLAFGEYYHPPGGGKILKTPRSGIQFATKEDDIFKEYKGDIVVPEERSPDEEPATAEKMIREAKSQAASLQKTLAGMSGVTVQGDLGGNITVPFGKVAPSPEAARIMTAEITRKNKDAKVFFSFNFKVNITYYDINDIYERAISKKYNRIEKASRQQSIPWYSQYAANTAFIQFLRAKTDSGNWQTLQNITSYILTRRINISGNSISETKQMTRSMG